MDLLATLINQHRARGRSRFGVPSGSDRKKAINATGIPALLINKSSTFWSLATVRSIKCSIQDLVNLLSLVRVKYLTLKHDLFPTACKTNLGLSEQSNRLHNAARVLSIAPSCFIFMRASRKDECPVSVSDSFPKDAELNFEIELIEFSKVKVVTEDLGILKKVIKEAQSWENPRDLYKIKARVSAKLGNGQPLQLATTSEPIMFTFGKSEVPKGLEMGIGTMSREEKSVIYVTSQYLSQSPLIPSVEGIEEVHFEVDFFSFYSGTGCIGRWSSNKTTCTGRRRT